MNAFFLTCSILSIAAFFVIRAAVSLYRNERKLTPHLTWCFMTAISAFFWFLPYFWLTDNAENYILKALKTLGATLQGIIRIFAVDETYADIVEAVAEHSVSAPVLQFYSGIGIFLYLLAPILTFGFILSLFKNIHAYAKYYSFLGKEVHIFSELNERSLALAESIVRPINEDDKDQKERKKRNILKNAPLIIFADILDKNEEEHLDLVANAKDIGAILFRQDITAIHFKRKNQKMYFYLISDEEPEKTMHMDHIISHYKNVPNTKLYIFSDSEESKCFLDSYPTEEKENMRLEVIRVNDIRSLIYHNLDVNGLRLFEHAHVYDLQGDISAQEREIHAVIVGFGRYGKELTKALLWYCQLPGYRVKITVFDEHEDTKDAFMAMCPEIVIDAPYQKKNDMRYEIHFECCKAGAENFYQKLTGLSPVTYVFVSLGEDNLNIATSMGIRSRLAMLRSYPDIETVIYNSAIKERIGIDWHESLPNKNTASAKKTYREIHNIHIIGDLDSFYSNKTVINSDLTKEGFLVHCRYCNACTEKEQETAKKTFYMDDYGFFSSVAKALHARLRKKISDQLNADDPQAQKMFYAFVTETGSDGKKIQNRLYWNRFVLENTLNTEKAKNLSKAINQYNKSLNANKIEIYPYRATPQEIQNLENLHLTCSYENNVFSSAQVIEIAKSAAEIEHVRWNAYMRAEGFSFIRDFNKPLDQPMKMHGNLTPCEELSFSDCVKDI